MRSSSNNDDDDDDDDDERTVEMRGTQLQHQPTINRRSRSHSGSGAAAVSRTGLSVVDTGHWSFGCACAVCLYVHSVAALPDFSTKSRQQDVHSSPHSCGPMLQGCSRSFEK